MAPMTLFTLSLFMPIWKPLAPMINESSCQPWMPFMAPMHESIFLESLHANLEEFHGSDDSALKSLHANLESVHGSYESITLSLFMPIWNPFMAPMSLFTLSLFVPIWNLFIAPLNLVTLRLSMPILDAVHSPDESIYFESLHANLEAFGSDESTLSLFMSILDAVHGSGESIYLESLHANLESVHGSDGGLGAGWVVEADEPEALALIGGSVNEHLGAYHVSYTQRKTVVP